MRYWASEEEEEELQEASGTKLAEGSGCPGPERKPIESLESRHSSTSSTDFFPFLLVTENQYAALHTSENKCCVHMVPICFHIITSNLCWLITRKVGEDTGEPCKPRAVNICSGGGGRGRTRPIDVQ